MAKLGKIKLTKAYQTTDGAKFTGPTAKDRAEKHQEKLNDRTKMITESRVPNIIKKASLPEVVYNGFLTMYIDYKNSKIKIEYAGNQGNGLNHVNKKLSEIIYTLSITQLEASARRSTRKGTPDNLWTLTLHY